MPDVIYNEDEVRVYETNSLGFRKLKFKGPKTSEVYDRRAGQVGASLESAIDNEIYRGTLPEWQKALSKHLETLGHKRQVDANRTEAAKKRSKTPEKVKDVLETVKLQIARARGSMDDAAKKQLLVDGQRLADEIYIDPQATTRERKVEKAFIEKAQGWLTLPDDQMESKVTTALDAVPGFELERDEESKPTEESLAELIKQYVDTLI